jgi:hypothetical protein
MHSARICSDERLHREDMGELIVINEPTGEHTELPLTNGKKA